MIVRLVLVLLLFGGVAYAQKSNDPTARAHIKRAKAHFDLQEYDAAVTELKAAYRIDAKPSILYAIAQAQRMANDCEAAIKSYKNFLRSKPPADQKKLAEDNIATCEAELAKPAPEPEPTPPPSPPPAPASERIEQPPTTPRSGVPWTSNFLGHGLVVTGLVALTAGTVVTLRAQAVIDDFNDAELYDDFIAQRQAAKDAQTRRTIGIIGAGAGIALVAAGIITYVVRSPSDEKVTVSIARNGSVGLAWTW